MGIRVISNQGTKIKHRQIKPMRCTNCLFEEEEGLYACNTDLQMWWSGSSCSQSYWSSLRLKTIYRFKDWG